MAYFRTVNFAESFPVVEGEGVFLRPPQSSDYADWAALRETSRAFLTPWEPTWAPDDQRTDQAYAFFLFRSDEVLVGGLTLANLRRGVAQTGSLGYWIGEAYARQGFMTAAVRALVPYAFSSLRLHRLEAACIPTNAASISLLEKTGFTREGYAREYLCINGLWQDHLLYARLKDVVRS